MPKCFYPNCENVAKRCACKEHGDLYAKWTNNNYNRAWRCNLPPLTLEEYQENTKKWWARLKSPRDKIRHRPKAPARDSHDGASSTAAKCPKCGKTHNVWMMWTGRGTPRVYCNVCRYAAATFSRLEPESEAKYHPVRQVAQAM